MANIIRLRMVTDEVEGFVRDYEIADTSDLLELHDHICEDLHYDPMAPASFFVSDAEWTKVSEFTLIDMGIDPSQDGLPAPRLMKGTPVGETVKSKGDRLLYLFDMFAERVFFLEVRSSTQANGEIDYPLTSLSKGEPPAQFSAEDDGGSIFDEALGEFGSFEGDEFYDDEY